MRIQNVLITVTIIFHATAATAEPLGDVDARRVCSCECRSDDTQIRTSEGKLAWVISGVSDREACDRTDGEPCRNERTAQIGLLRSCIWGFVDSEIDQAPTQEADQDQPQQEEERDDPTAVESEKPASDPAPAELPESAEPPSATATDPTQVADEGENANPPIPSEPIDTSALTATLSAEYVSGQDDAEPGE